MIVSRDGATSAVTVQQAVSPLGLSCTIGVLVSISMIGPLSVHLFFPLMPLVKADFSVPDAKVGLAFSLSLLVMSVVTLVYGSLSDRHGRRPVLLAGVGLFCAGSVLSAFAPTFEVLLGFRLLGGVAAGGIMPVAMASIGDKYPPAVRQLASRARTHVRAARPRLEPIDRDIGDLAVVILIARLAAPGVLGEAQRRFEPADGMMRVDFSPPREKYDPVHRRTPHTGRCWWSGRGDRRRQRAQARAGPRRAQGRARRTPGRPPVCRG